MRGVGDGALGQMGSSVCQSVAGSCWGVDVTGCDEPNPLLQPSACLPNSLQGPLSSWSCCLLPRYQQAVLGEPTLPQLGRGEDFSTWTCSPSPDLPPTYTR